MARTIFTDADNTLWDTNVVYAAAQIAMLRDVEELTGKSVHADSQGALAFVRKLDQGIAVRHPRRLRYPPKLLARALAAAVDGQDVAAAEVDALPSDDTENALDRIALGFIERLKALPRLRIGVRRGLTMAALLGARVTILTEGGKERCLQVLTHHGLENAVEDVISLAKTPSAFSLIAERVVASRPIMVGDQLDRDIQFSSAAGFETFFFPSPFVPVWIEDIVASPDHEISSFDEILPFLDE